MTWEILQGDCLEVMRGIEDKTFDLVITSPPYNLGKGHHTGNRRTDTYFDNMTEKDYQEWQVKVLNECYRVLRDGGSMIYNHKNRIKKGVQITPYEWLLKTKFIVKQEIVWFNRSQNFDKIRFYPMTERVYWLAKHPSTKLFNAINHHDLFDTKDWPTVGTKGKHKRAFPEQMVRDILRCFPEAKTVLDPFAGSGTTLLASEQMGRDSIGIEISEEYCETIKRRMANMQMTISNL